MTTFSQLIDDTIIELVRPDMDNYLASYLNQTIREIHMFSRDGTPVFFDENRAEELVSLANMPDDKVYLWAIPQMNLFQAMEAVFYDSIYRYVEQRSPRTAMIRTGAFDDTYYWYRSGQYIALSNPGANGQTVKMSYFRYPRSLIYYPNGTSPILYDRAADTYVLNPKYTGPVLTLDEAMDRSTNWLLQKHEHMIQEGLRAKVWKRADDQNRMRVAYSSFENQKLAIQQSAQAIYLAKYGR